MGKYLFQNLRIVCLDEYHSISLSSLTGGRASFTTKFASYELVPSDIQSKLIADHEAELAKEAE